MLTLEDLLVKLNANLHVGSKDSKVPKQAFGSDLMSDVLTLEDDDILLITGLANPQTIRTAEMADIKMIIIARGKEITDEMKQLAQDNGITLLSSPFSMFKVCGLLHEQGLKPLFNMETFKLKYQVKESDFSNAGHASSDIKKQLKMLGMPAAIVKRMVVSIYEAEVNMIAHAHGGEITVTIDEEKTLAVVKDVGPGIPDVDQAMQKGYSTASEEVRQMGFGAGMGLPNIDKNADELLIDSVLGQGTTLKITITYI